MTSRSKNSIQPPVKGVQVSSARGRRYRKNAGCGHGEQVSAPLWSHCTVLRREDDSKPSKVGGWRESGEAICARGTCLDSVASRMRASAAHATGQLTKVGRGFGELPRGPQLVRPTRLEFRLKHVIKYCTFKETNLSHPGVHHTWSLVCPTDLRGWRGWLNRFLSTVSR